MDEWNNHSFIIWRTRNSGNAVRERGGDTREGGRGGMMMRIEEKGKVQKEKELRQCERNE